MGVIAYALVAVRLMRCESFASSARKRSASASAGSRCASDLPRPRLPPASKRPRQTAKAPALSATLPPSSASLLGWRPTRLLPASAAKKWLAHLHWQAEAAAGQPGAAILTKVLRAQNRAAAVRFAVRRRGVSCKSFRHSRGPKIITTRMQLLRPTVGEAARGAEGGRQHVVGDHPNMCSYPFMETPQAAFQELGHTAPAAEAAPRRERAARSSLKLRSGCWGRSKLQPNQGPGAAARSGSSESGAMEAKARRQNAGLGLCRLFGPWEAATGPLPIPRPKKDAAGAGSILLRAPWQSPNGIYPWLRG